MNRAYKLVFNYTLGLWQVVSEIAKGRGKFGRSKSGRSSRRAAAAAALAVTLGLGSVGSAQAVTYTVGAGGSFNGIVPTTIANGDIINLLGATATLGNNYALPTGAVRLSGTEAGSTLTLGNFRFTANDGAVLNLYNTTITGGNQATNGGAILALGALTLNAVNAAGTLDPAGAITLSNNLSSGDGGGIYSVGAVTLTGGKQILMDSNQAGGRGGAILADGAINLSADQIILTNNKALTSDGGTLYSNSSTVTLTGGSLIQISSNQAGGFSGGIWAQGAVSLSAAQITLNDNKSNGSGGAVYTNANITVTGALTGNNNSANHGSVLYAAGDTAVNGNNGDITQSGGNVSLSGNQTTNNGGAIFATRGNVTIDGVLTATGNRAGVGGAQGAGGVIADLAGNVNIVNGVQLTNNTANLFGGGIYAGAGNVALATVSGNAVLTGNLARGADGGVIYANGSVSIGNAGGVVDIENNFAGYALINSALPPAVGNITGSAAVNGGAISSTGTTTLNGSAITLSGNRATNVGGVIYSAGAVNITGAVAANSNLAGGFNTVAQGGVIYAGNGITINGSLSANSNRAISTLSTAGYGSGGVLSAAAGNINVTGNVSLTNNIAQGAGTATATGYGGAIYAVGAGASVNLATGGGNVTLTGNVASGLGGAISVSGGINSVSIGGAGSNINISNNFAGYRLTDLTYTGNISFGDLTETGVGDAGGAIYSAGSTTINGSTITLSNNVSGNNAGAIYSAGTTTINGSTITLSNNVAGATTGSGAGGAIVSMQALSITGDVTFENNTAGYGGAIYAGNTPANTLTFAGGNTLFKTNSATSFGGGAIYANVGQLTINIGAGNSLTFQDNTSTASAGAIATGALIVNGGAGSDILFDSNTATDNGGAISASAVTMNSDAINLSNNTAGGRGGAIYSVGNTTFNVAAGGTMSATGNTATAGAASGGFLYANAGSIVFNVDTGASATIGNNHSLTDGTDSIATGAGVTFTKQGAGILTLQNRNLISDNATLTAGALAIDQAGTLNTNGSYIQSAGTTLNLTVVTADRSATDAFITANTATLAGTINVDGFTASGTFAKASDVLLTPTQLLIDASAGGANSITGDFTTKTFGGVAFANGLPDYLYGGIYKTNNNSQVVAGIDLSWFGDASNGHGTFTVDAANPFNVDVSLANMNPGGTAYYTGFNWDGKTLTKAGDGTLKLSATNTYSGNTVIQEGTVLSAHTNGSGIVDTLGSGTVIFDNASNANKTSTLRFDTDPTLTNRQVITAGSTGTDSIAAGQQLTITTPAFVGNGGAVQMGADSTYNLDGDITFLGNSATNFGGAIYGAGATTINLLGGNVAFQGNTSTINGGAIYSVGALTLNGNLIANSNITGGGAVLGQGGAIYSGNGITINGTLTADSNRATSTLATADVGSGGVLFASSGNVVATGGVSLTNNVARSGGGSGTAGAIYTADVGSSVNLATNGGDVTLMGNVASGSAGAIYAASGGINIGNAGSTVNIQNNFAGYTLSNTAYTGDITLVNLTPVNTTSGGGALNSGGGINIVGSSVTLSNNQASQHGGAVRANGPVTIDAADITIANNKAGSGGGGAIYASGANGTVTLGRAGGTTTITGNQASSAGGAIFAGGLVTINGNLIANSNITGGGAVTGQGGAIYSGNGITINGTLTADSNRATTTNNTPNYGSGGVLYANTGDINVSGNVNLTNNVAQAPVAGSTVNGYGGAIYAAAAGANINLASNGGDVTLTGNVASRFGGAVATATTGAGSVTIGNTGNTGTITLSNNFAGYALNAPDFTGDIDISQISVSGASGSGGAIYSIGAVTINGSAITLSNNAARGGGGAIYSGGAVTINGDLTVTNNTGAIGGAIYSNGKITLTGDVVLTNNRTASGTGGAMISNSDILITGSLTANNNAATTVGGMAASVNFTQDNGDVSMSGNFGSVFGGAISVTSNASLATTSGNVSLTNNSTAGSSTYTAYDGGGAIFSRDVGAAVGNLDGTVTLTGNKAGVDALGASSGRNASGGAIMTLGAAAINGKTITIANNQASYRGGAIWTNNGATFNVAAGGTMSVTGNTAADAASGGFLYAEAFGGAGTGGSIVFNTGAGATATIGNNHSLLDGTDSIATTSGSGVTFAKTGAGLLTLQNRNLIDGNAMLTAGTLAIDQAGTLNTNSSYIQNAAATLNLTVTGDRTGADAFITANGAVLAGTINVDGFTASGTFAKASEVLLTPTQLLIDASAGGANSITGDFSTKTFGGVAFAGGLPDYLYGGIYKTNNNSQVVAGVDLSWFGNADTGHGTFTVDAANPFNVDVTLANMNLGPYASGWNGSTLTKGGLGTLTLSKVNTYTGGSVIKQGTLIADANTANPADALGTGTVTYDNTTDNSSTLRFISDGAVLGNRQILTANSTGTLSIATGQQLTVTTPAFVGNGGAVTMGAGSTYNLDGDITFLGNSATNFGGAIYGAGATTINIAAGSPVVFDGNTATTNGSAIYSGGAATINGDLTVTNNTGAIGGAIYSLGGTTITGSLTANNNASSSTGGALYAAGGLSQDNGDVSMSGNYASSRSGAIYGGGSVSLAATSGNVSLTNNSTGGASISTAADGGGALYSLNNVAVGNLDGTVTLSGNKAGVTALGAPSGINANGGAVMSGAGVFGVGTTTINGNQITIANNQASYRGGAIWTTYGATFNVAAGGSMSVTGNTALNAASGGFLYAEAFGGAGTGGSIVFNIGTDASATIGNNHSLTDGTDSIATTTGLRVTFEKTGAGLLTLQNRNTIDGNATLTAGTLAIDQAGTLNTNSSYIQNAAATLNLTVTGDRTGADAFITANGAVLAGTINVDGFTASGTFTKASEVLLTPTQLLIDASAGGANSITGDFSTKTFGGVAFAGGLPDYLYGGIYKTNNNSQVVAGIDLSWFGDATTGHGTFTVDAANPFNADVTLANMNLGPYASGWNGSALTKAGAGTLKLSATNTYSGNTVIQEGTVLSAHTDASGIVDTLGSGTVIFDNASNANKTSTLRFDTDPTLTTRQIITAGSTGTLSIAAGQQLTVTTPVFAGNGGAVQMGAGSTYNLDGDITFLGNSVAGAGNGGAIYGTGVTTINISAGSPVVFDGNTATANGGAIYSVGALTINGNATFNNNNTAGNGGAIYAANGLTINGNLTATDNIGGSSGGALSVLGNITITGDVLMDNNSSSYGGAASGGAISGGTVTIGHVGGTTTLTNNHTDAMGGAIGASSGISITGNLLAQNNTATDGGAFYVMQDGDIVVAGGDINLADNTATGSGGAIFADDILAPFFGSSGFANVSITADTLSLSNNHADGGDGGAILARGDITLSGALSIADNTASDKGGAIYAGTGATFNLSGTSSITGNTAVDAASGGFLYAGFGSIVFNVGAGADATIGNNHSLTDGTDSIATSTGGVTFEKTGAGTLTLKNLNLIDGNATLTAGTLAFDQAGTLNTNSSYTQNANGTLNLTVVTGDRAGTDAFITANTATLAGAIDVDGYTLPTGTFDKASDVLATSKQLLIDATAGGSADTITGDFTTKMFGGVAYAGGLPDYLYGGIYKTNNNTQVMAGFDLSWFGDANAGHGTFTLPNAADTFNVDVPLADMNLGPYASWNGSTLTKEGLGTLLLTGANTYTGGTNINDGIVRIALTSATSNTNLGSGTVFIGAPGTLITNTMGAFSFDNALTGTGLLSASNNGGSFSFGAGAGNAFQGTVALTDNTFLLDGVNTTALTKATLLVGTGNITTVSSGDPAHINTQTIGGLTIDGGTLSFYDDMLSDPDTAGIKVTGALDINRAGTIQIFIPDGFVNNLPDAQDIHSRPILEQDAGSGDEALSRLIEVDVAGGGTVIGTGNSLQLIDQDNNPVTNSTVIGIVQNDFTVANGTYDLRLTPSTDADGLYVAYGLTQVELLGSIACAGNSTGGCGNPTVAGMNNALTLTPAPGATGFAADLSAKVTGAGDLEIDAGAGKKVSLSNVTNDYTGQTLVTSGTLQLGSDGSIPNSDAKLLGYTSDLRVAGGGVVEMMGYSQKVGALDTVAGGKVNITAGSTLTITDAQRATGNTLGGGIDTDTLAGSGAIVIDPSIVYVNGDQPGYTGLVTVTGGSELVMNSASAFNSASGIGLATAADTLIFGSAAAYDPTWTAIPNGTASVALSGLGSVQVNDGSVVNVSGNNSAFAGVFDINANGLNVTSKLIVSSAQNLGAATMINNAGVFEADALTPAASWTLTTAMSGAGSFIVNGTGPNAGTGTVTIGIDNAANGMTGPTTIAGGVLELTNANGVGTGLVTVATPAGDLTQGLTLNLAAAQSFVNTLTGAGTTTVAQTSQLATITGANSGYSGMWRIAGAAAIDPASTISTARLGSGAVNIAAGGLLAANTVGAFSFNNALTGAGLLAASNNGNAFSFGSGAGNAFAGTLTLTGNTFLLDGGNTTALTNATLEIGVGNVTTVGNGDQAIGGLVFNGGTMIFDATAPAQATASSFITVQTLDASGTGVVQINVPDPYALPTPTPAGDESLFQQSHANAGLQLIAATNNVIGSGSGLTLQDQDGNAISGARNVNVNQNGNLVAVGTYNYMLGTGAANDGLYVGYGLNRLDLRAGQSLTLAEDAGATGNDADLAAQLTGTGNLVIAATDTVSLSNPTNSFTGTTTVASGTLQARAADVIASSSAVTIDAGTTFDTNGYNQSLHDLNGGGDIKLSGNNVLTLDDSAAANTFAGVISGAGALTKTGDGVLTLAGANTYSGPTTISVGTLVIAPAGSIASDVINNALFENNGTVTGSVTNVTGTTTNNGVITGAVTVVGGLFTGTGTAPVMTVASGGIFQPGDGRPGSSATVNSNLAFQPGAAYAVSIDPNTSSLATVSGTATLGGAAVNAIYADGSYSIQKKYTILTASGGVDGVFNNLINTNLPANFSPSLTYDPHNVYLNMMLNYVPGPDFGGGLNIQQQNVANALTDYFDRTGSIPAVFGALTPDDLSQASGELATTIQQTTFDAMNQFMGAMTDAAGAGRDCAACGDDVRADAGGKNFSKERRATGCQATSDKAWATVYGGGRDTDGNTVAGSHTATGRVYGLAAGADYAISADTVAGFALAGGLTNFDLGGGLGSGRSDLVQAGVYGRHHMGPAYLAGMLAYGWQDITTKRNVTVDGLDHLRADFDTNAFSGRLEGGWGITTAWGAFTPYTAAQFTTVDLPGYSERATSGADTFALRYHSKTATAWRSELGLRAGKTICLTDGALTLGGRLAWAHDFGTDRDITATLQTLPGASFTVNGASVDNDAALITIAAEMTWSNGWSFGAAFDSEFSDASRSYTGSAALRYRW